MLVDFGSAAVENRKGYHHVLKMAALKCLCYLKKGNLDSTTVDDDSHFSDLMIKNMLFIQKTFQLTFTVLHIINTS